MRADTTAKPKCLFTSNLPFLKNSRMLPKRIRVAPSRLYSVGASLNITIPDSITATFVSWFTIETADTSRFFLTVVWNLS